MGKNINRSATMMNKILEIAEAEKLFEISNIKLEILIHPESLVHAIVEFKNGLKKFIYHDTTMVIPIANAIFDKNLDIKNFYKSKEDSQIKNLTFSSVDSKLFH